MEPIAHITGTALRPGVSKNRRWYKSGHVVGAVTKAQERLAAGERPMVMLTFHGAEDDSKEIAAALTSASLAEDGRFKFAADIPGTPAGWTIAKLADTSGGKPAALRNVSIRGAWTGQVRRVHGPDGQLVETGDGLEIDGIDFTKDPGVEGAEIETFAWAADGQNETSERVLITESVEAAVTFSETTEGAEGAASEGTPPPGVGEVLAVLLGPGDPELAEAATPAMSKRKSGLSGSGRVWADPGYQADKKQRYDITTKAVALTAWRYVNQPAKAARYTSAQLKQVKSRIRAALKKFGVTTSTESALAGWTFESWQVSDTVAEYYGDPSRSGSWCITASNGDVSLTMSSYCMNPKDLDPVLRTAVDAACGALKTLDPDMDGDVDVPGTDGDTDHDAGHENAPDPDDPATESTAGDPAPAGDSEQEESVMAESSNSTSGAGATPGLTAEAIAEAAATAMAKVFEARDAAKAKAKADAKAAEAKEAAEKQARKDALTEALAELGIKVPGQGAGSGGEGGGVTEGAGDAGGESVSEAVKAEAQRIAKEMFTEFVQEAHASGAILPGRSGFTVREHAVPDADNAPSGDDLRKMSDDALFDHMGGAMAQHADKMRPVGAPA